MTQSGLTRMGRFPGGGENIELKSESQERLSCCKSKKIRWILSLSQNIYSHYSIDCVPSQLEHLHYSKQKS